MLFHLIILLTTQNLTLLTKILHIIITFTQIECQWDSFTLQILSSSGGGGFPITLQNQYFMSYDQIKLTLFLNYILFPEATNMWVFKGNYKRSPIKWEAKSMYLPRWPPGGNGTQIGFAPY